LNKDKVLADAISIQIGYWCDCIGAISNDKSLYIWSEDRSSDTYKKVKALDNVKSFASYGSIFDARFAAITEDGNLYELTGDNFTPKQITFPSAKSNHSIAKTTVLSLTDTVSSKLTTPSAVSKDSVEAKVAQFNNLQPDETYNFYVMKSSDSENAFNADNLLYINQGIADSDGNLSFSYWKTETTEDVALFVVGMKTDISNADVYVDDIFYNGNAQSAKPSVTYKGKALEEGIDYEVLGEYEATNVGTYQLTIKGIGDFYGEVNVTYQVVNESIGTGEPDSGVTTPGDADCNKKVDLNDAKIVLKISLGIYVNVSEQGEKNADYDNSGKVDLNDAKYVLKEALGIKVTL